MSDATENNKAPPRLEISIESGCKWVVENSPLLNVDTIPFYFVTHLVLLNIYYYNGNYKIINSILKMCIVQYFLQK